MKVPLLPLQLLQQKSQNKLRTAWSCTLWFVCLFWEFVSSCDAAFLRPTTTATTRTFLPLSFREVKKQQRQQQQQQGLIIQYDLASSSSSSCLFLTQPEKQQQQQQPEHTVVNATIGAPFMCSYPRYRVDLTRVKRWDSKHGKNSNSNNNHVQQLLFGSNVWQWAAGAASSSSLLQLKQQQVKRQLARKFPNARTIHVVAKSDNNNNNNNHINKLDSLSSFSFPTCHAMCELWSAAANVQNDGHERVVAFMDGHLYGVARNFCDLIDWCNNNMANDDDNNNNEQGCCFAVAVEYMNDQDDSRQINNSNNNKKKKTSHDISSFPSPPIVVRLKPCRSTSFVDDATTTATTMTDLVAEDEDVINERTRAWVQRLLVEMGICPFTKNKDKSGQGLKAQGVPVGRIAYHAFTTMAAATTTNKTKSQSTSTLPSSSSSLWSLICPLSAQTWEAVYDMLLAGPNGREGGISSILLAAPAFDEDFAFWAGPVFALLEASVVAAQAEPYLGVVCFHPLYAVSDGSSWPGFGHMHSLPRLQKWMDEKIMNTATTTTTEMTPTKVTSNSNDPTAAAATVSSSSSFVYSQQEVAAGGAWQRRTPHATINVLRANQLAAAEQLRSSNDLYPRNIQVLLNLGSKQLYQDLQRERQMGKDDHHNGDSNQRKAIGST